MHLDADTWVAEIILGTQVPSGVCSVGPSRAQLTEYTMPVADPENANSPLAFAS